MIFCNYCKCGNCKDGTELLYHAETISGDWICDCCYGIDLCTKDPEVTSGPCENWNCKHRPKLIGSWYEYERKN